MKKAVLRGTTMIADKSVKVSNKKLHALLRHISHKRQKEYEFKK